MLLGRSVVSGVTPPDLLSQQISLLGPVVMDAVPRGAAFGDVLLQPLPAYRPGQQVEAMFR
jgi:neutral ceramidase